MHLTCLPDGRPKGIEIMNIVMPGEALFAPIVLPVTGVAPSWSGKSVYELSQQYLEEVNSFCLDDAWEMGYEDSMDGRAERENPFHRAFLNGVSSALFAVYYRRGRAEACGEGMSLTGELFAA